MITQVQIIDRPYKVLGYNKYKSRLGMRRVTIYARTLYSAIQIAEKHFQEKPEETYKC